MRAAEAAWGSARNRLAGHIDEHLGVLCRPGGRLVGTPGNLAATSAVRDVLTALGWDVAYPSFACLRWRRGGARVEAAGESVPVLPGPYSLPFSGELGLVAAATMDELATVDARGRALLLHGSLTTEPLAPRNYVFYNPEGHQAIYRLIDRQRPAVVLAATGTCPSTAGAEYPFALFDDGDFDVPSAYLKDIDGSRLLKRTGEQVTVTIESDRCAATAHNVIATSAPPAGSLTRARRIVLTAHVDSRPGTPGALDDAAGVVTMLAAAELLSAGGQDRGSETVEIAILNGEDYYAASGERAYMAANEGRWDEIALAVNVDGAGYLHGATASSFYDCPGPLRSACETALAPYPGIIPGPQWVQGDHSLFVMQGVPALAFTSESMAQLWAEVAHTGLDRPGLVDAGKLAELAEAIVAVVRRVGIRGAEPAA